MSVGINKLASELQKVIEERDKNKKSPYDTEAEVVRVDSDIVWVKIPGGVDETPAQKTVNAKTGDKVQVRVSGGRAFLVGNGTNPPTDDTVANVAISDARDANQNAVAAGAAAVQAIESANTANEKAYEASVAAAQAQTDAGIAHTAANEAKADAAAANTAATQAKADAAAASTAAGEAKTAANEAKADAQAANTAATEAKADAARANTAANDSLSQLSIVEDVVGTLNWITTHATYKASADTEVHAGKWYFTKSGSTYNVVTNPTGNPSAKGYYEVDTIDEAVSNYVASHLALTNEGLYLTKDGNGYKILLANDGLKVYDPEGHLVSTFGESIIFDSARPQTIGNNNVYIKYYDKNNDGTPDSLAIKADEFLLSSGKTIQEELEGVENWFYSVAPTTSNPPASSWTTDKLKEQHLRDIYFDTTSGKSYRWAKEGTTYKWVEIEDVELAALAKDLHDNYPPRSEFTVAPNKIQSTVSAAQTAATNAANTATDNKLKSYSTTTQMNSAIEQKAGEITASVSSTYETKSDATSKLNTAKGYTDSEITSAKAEIKVTTDGISTEVSKKVGASEVISKINQSAETVKIQASKVEIDGTATFNAIKSKADAAYDVIGAASTALGNAYNAMGGFTILWDSNAGTTYAGGEAKICKYDPETGTVSQAAGWAMWNGTKRTVPNVEFNPNSVLPYNIPIYLVLRLSSATSTTGTVYPVWYASGWKYNTKLSSPAAADTADWTWVEATDMVLGKCVEPSGEGVFTECETYNPPWNFKAISNITTTAASAQSTANAAKTTADAAAPKTSAVAEEQYIYISKASGTTSVSGTTTWITETGDKQNTWTTKRPTYNTIYPVLFVAKQKKVVSGTVTCTTPVKDDTTTVIDGGHITTGTIDSNRLNADTIKVNAANIQGSLTIGQLPSTVAETSDIPTKVSQLTNDSGYQTSSQVSTAINNVRSWYATCSTAAGTAAKVATITPTTTAFTTSVLTAGTLVNVKFTVTNTAAVGDLTLNVNNTGAKHIKTLRYGVINNIAAVGYLAQNVTYQFTYDGTYWVMQENYNADTTNRTRWQNVIAAAEAITNGHIICGTASGYRNIAANISFDMDYPLLYAATAIAKGATTGTRDNNFLEINSINASTNGTITSGAANKVLFLKGTLTSNTFKIATSPFMTTVAPTSQDNFCYIPLGIMYSATNIYFRSSDQLYAYKDGAFGPVSVREASAAAKTATSYITDIGNDGIRIHDSHTTNNSVVINSDGMEIFKGGTDDAHSIAKYADNVRIGKEASSHITIYPKSLEAFDYNQSTYFTFGDVNGISCTLNAVGTAYLKDYNILPYTGTPVVKLNGTTQTLGTHYTISNNIISFKTAPDVGDVIEITFTPVKNASYFTFGTRKADTAKAPMSATFGNNNNASGLWAFASGNETTASGTGAHAEGNLTIASASYAHAEGMQTVASGARAHAEGIESRATGNNAHAEGNTTRAIGNNTHAEGAWGYWLDDPDVYLYSKAEGPASHVEGCSESESTAMWAHAEGFRSIAKGRISHAGGQGTIAKGKCQTAIGAFNIEQGTTDTFSGTDNVFIIGNGNRASDGTVTRSNAFSMKWNGDIESCRVGNILWTGAGWYMTASQTATFTNGQKLSDQLTGIVLVWSAYSNNAAQNNNFFYQFVPKWHVYTHPSSGICAIMPDNNMNTNTVCKKYVYVHDDKVVGNDNNNATGTGFNNKAKVLRAIIGV